MAPDRLVDAADISNYRPVLTFSVNRAWTHGYRVGYANVMAAATLAAPLPSASAASARARLRSRFEHRLEQIVQVLLRAVMIWVSVIIPGVIEAYARPTTHRLVVSTRH